MRIEQIMNATGGLESTEIEPEPEPLGLNPYARQLVMASRALPDNVRLHDWVSDPGESRIVMRSKKIETPLKIEASLAGRAFENYVSFSIDDRHELEYRAAKAMHDIDPSICRDDTNVMLNYVPLLFTGRHMVAGYRERYGDAIIFSSDKLLSARERHVLIGGLATIFYYADYPNKL